MSMRSDDMVDKRPPGTVVRGRAWVFGDFINSESMLPTSTQLLDFEAAPKFVLTAYRPEFAPNVKPGDIVIGGRAFGSSSSRPAGAVLRMIGVGAVVAEGIGRIFFRNSWSLGMPVYQCKGITKAVKDGDQVEVNLETGEVTNLTTGVKIQAQPPFPICLEIFKAGGLKKWIESRRAQYATLNPK